jgi:hypothetical protein
VGENESWDWDESALGSHVITKEDARVAWDFTISDDYMVLGLVRVRDTKHFYLKNPTEFVCHVRCGWFYYIRQGSRFWSVVRENSDYMGERAEDRRYAPGKARLPGTRGPFVPAERLRMVLDGNTLTVAFVGTNHHTLDAYTEIDRSEPLVMAVFLKPGVVVTITNFSVSKTMRQEGEK